MAVLLTVVETSPGLVAFVIVVVADFVSAVVIVTVVELVAGMLAVAVIVPVFVAGCVAEDVVLVPEMLAATHADLTETVVSKYA